MKNQDETMSNDYGKMIRDADAAKRKADEDEQLRKNKEDQRRDEAKKSVDKWYNEVFSQELGAASDSMRETGATFFVTGDKLSSGIGKQFFIKRGDKAGPAYTVSAHEGRFSVTLNAPAQTGRRFVNEPPSAFKPRRNLQIGNDDSVIPEIIAEIVQDSLSYIT